MPLHLVTPAAPDAGLAERFTDLVWLARDAAAAALLAAAAKVAPGATLTAHRLGFGGHVSARMVAIGDNSTEIDLVSDRFHGATGGQR